MYLVAIFGQVYTLHTLHKSRGFWRVENSYTLLLPLLSKNPRGLDYQVVIHHLYPVPYDETCKDIEILLVEEEEGLSCLCEV